MSFFWGDLMDLWRKCHRKCRKSGAKMGLLAISEQPLKAGKT
jgi:hypothetical protein